MKNTKTICTTSHNFHEIEYGEEGHFRYGRQCSVCHLTEWYGKEKNERLNRAAGYLI